MRRIVTLGVVLALCATLIAAITTQPILAKPSRKPVVLRDEQAGIHVLKTVPPQQPDTTTEPSIAVNPENPLNAVAGYQAGRVDAGCAQTNGYATTFDGGRTWTYGALPKLTTANGGEYALASDPVVAFGPDDTVYFNSLMCGSTNDLAFSVSKNGGRTWSKPIMVPVERTLPFDDKNWIVVDNGEGLGHHLGRVYLVWDNIAPVVAMYSDDQAQTWHGPFLIYPGQGIGTIPLVMPNGDLALVFITAAYPGTPLHRDPGDFDSADVTSPLNKYIISIASGAGLVPTGGPLVFAPPLSVATYRGTDVRGHRAAEDLPAAAVDPKSGAIYVAWGDNRFRDDVVNDIVFVRSEDGGLTWTAPKKINPGKANDFVEHFTPAIEVGDDGSVRIAYRTQQQADNIFDFRQTSPFVDTYYQESTDGGETWSAPLKVNRGVRTDVRFATYSRQSAFLGDYSQLAVTGSWTYIVRCEAFRLSPGEPAIWPPKVHHQRTWVAVVDSDGNGKP